MAKKDNQNGVYKRPQRGWSPATNRIVGIVFLVFVMICFVIRGFVGGKADNNKNGDGKSQVTSSEENTTDMEKTDEANNVTDKTSKADGKYYTFRNESTLESHYEKHGSEFDYHNANEYQDGANDVINNPASLHKTEAEDGDDVYYLESTNEFVIVSTDGYIRTYFKPSDGKAYYDRQ
ncbi:MAG: hypothetical protein J6L77_10320 [Coprococcus sp.]|nr:hypothetical protein [Coprococcus sp.]